MTVITAGKCSRTEPQCCNVGVARCVTCKAWYCSAQCQADHWPRHWRECLPLPDLEWLVKDDKTQNAVFVQKNLSSQTPSGESSDQVVHVGSAKLQDIVTTEHLPTKRIEPKTDETKTIDVGSTDSSLQGEASSTPVKTTPETSEPKDSAPSVAQVTVSPSPTVPETKEKPKSSETAKSPEKVVQVADLPSQDKTVKETTAAPSAVTRTTSQTSSPSMYSEAQYSSNLPRQMLTKKVNEIISPVDVIESPSNFVVRLAESEEICIGLLSSLNESQPAPAPDNWKVGRKAVVAAYFDDIWYRAMAVKKTGTSFVCYLLDFGNMVTISQSNMRPLPNEFLAKPPCAFQVCLAGFGPKNGTSFIDDEVEVYKEIINSDVSYKLVAEFLGQGEGGRWIVNLKGRDDGEDTAALLIGGEVGIKREDKIVKTFEDIFDLTNNNVSEPVVDDNKNIAPTPESKKAEVQEEPPIVKTKAKSIQGPSIPRGSLEEGSNKVQGGVCFFERPDVFYVCSTDMVELFTSILEKSQEDIPGTVDPVIGSCVLALDDETCWYRAEITSLSADKMTTSLFLIDYGKEVTSEVANLRPLPSELHKYPGLVAKVKLNGIKPINGEAWTDADRDAAMLVLDVGGQTLFEFQNVKKEEGEVTLDLMDTDGNDVADFMIQTGCAQPINEDLSGIKLAMSEIKVGKVDLLVLSTVSPMEMYFCTDEMFGKYSDFASSVIHEVAAAAGPVTSLKVGDIVLALYEDMWYRARIMDVPEGDLVLIDLFDMAMIREVPKKDLRKASLQVCDFPVMAAKCCFSSWAGKDEKEAAEKFGKKIGELLEDFSQVEAEVIEAGDVNLIKIPSVEDKLEVKPAPALSRADMLKLKLRKN